MSVPLKVGVIGLGVGEQHIVGFRKSGKAEVVALCDLDAEKRKMARRKYPECRIYEHGEQLIDDPEVTVVSIASFDSDHAGQILHAFALGKHVFSEKPLCLKESDLSDIRHAIKLKPNLRLSTNTILRKSPRFIDLRDRIRNKSIGDIYHIEADYNYGRIEKLMNGWRGKIKNYSVMMGGGIHIVDLLMWLSGQKITEVSAVGNKLCSVNAEFSTPDMVVSWVKFSDGMIGKIGANFGCVFPHFHKLSVYGTKATFENSLQDALLYTSRDPSVPPQKLSTAYPGVGKGDLIPSFIGAILGEGKADVSEEEVFSAMDVCFAIDRSLQSGKAELVL